MKWVLIALGVIVVLVVAVTVIGMLLPKGHVASRKIKLNKPASEVWLLLTDYANHPGWRSNLKKIERLEDANGHEVWREDCDGMSITLETTESAPPHRLVRRIVDKNLPFGGEWVHELKDAEGGCVLTITEKGEVYNPIFRFMSRFVFGQTSTIDQFLAGLASKCGTKAAPEPS